MLIRFVRLSEVIGSDNKTLLAFFICLWFQFKFNMCQSFLPGLLCSNRIETKNCNTEGCPGGNEEIHCVPVYIYTRKQKGTENGIINLHEWLSSQPPSSFQKSRCLQSYLRHDNRRSVCFQEHFFCSPSPARSDGRGCRSCTTTHLMITVLSSTDVAQWCYKWTDGSPDGLKYGAPFLWKNESFLSTSMIRAVCCGASK